MTKKRKESYTEEMTRKLHGSKTPMEKVVEDSRKVASDIRTAGPDGVKLSGSKYFRGRR